MEKKLMWTILIVLVLSLLANVTLLVMLQTMKGSSQEITGFSINEGDNPLFENDVIEISKAELAKCCSFLNSEGEEDSCYVLKDYDCSYCADYCK